MASTHSLTSTHLSLKNNTHTFSAHIHTSLTYRTPSQKSAFLSLSLTHTYTHTHILSFPLPPPFAHILSKRQSHPKHLQSLPRCYTIFRLIYTGQGKAMFELFLLGSRKNTNAFMRTHICTFFQSSSNLLRL